MAARSMAPITKRRPGTPVAEPSGMRLLAAILFGLGACADSSLVVSNRSAFEIDEIYVTQIENPSWGPNLLYTTLAPGETINVDICCGTYDTLVVDETGAECEVPSVELCFEKDDWVIGNESCSVFAAPTESRHHH